MNVKFISSSSMFRFNNVVIMGIVIIGLSIIIAGMAAAQTKEDSTEVLAQIEKYRSVWNTHDSGALAEFFTEDADFIMGNQPLILERGGIEKWWRKYFTKQEPERKLTIDLNSLRIITSDVAVINIGTTTGGKDNQGKDLINRKARGTWVMHYQNGNWLIAAMRGMPTEEDQIIRNSSQ